VVGELAGRLEDASIIGLAARAALEVDRGAGVDARRVLPRKLELDVGVQNFLPRRAAGVTIVGAEKVGEVMTI
jgi:hypothetical protein